MEREKLMAILESHKLWLANDPSGQRANLRGADLRGANLRGANLRGANLREVDLRGADLRAADLRFADLRAADLQGADLQVANLRGTGVVRVYMSRWEITVYPGGIVAIGCERNPIDDWLAQPIDNVYGNSVESEEYAQIKAIVLAIVGVQEKVAK